MPRPQKKRYVCKEPENGIFVPCGGENGKVELLVEEYETLRLIDLGNFTQEECAAQMQVSRTTVQSIYEQARRKVADSIVNGKRLLIQGGEYETCKNYERRCGKNCKGFCFRRFNEEHIKKEYIMRIAVTYQDGEIFQHFGHTEKFEIYDVENGKIVDRNLIDTNGSGHGALAELLKSIKVDVLICGGIGGGAQSALSEAGIKLYGGVSGACADAVNALLSDSLDFNPDVKCNHHHEHGAEHHCGENHQGCGGNGHCGR